MALACSSFIIYFCFIILIYLIMDMSEFYSEFLFRYQTEGAPHKVSINTFCIREGIGYRNFIR